MENGKWKIVIVAVLLSVLPLAARKQYTIRMSSAYPSVTVNEDSTVSFCYCGAARTVSVQSDFLYRGEDSTRYDDLKTRRVKMHLESDGCFHITTRPLQLETYTYCFRVNDKRRPDPNNKDTVWQMVHKWNIVSLGGTPEADLYHQPAQQGKLIRSRWYSTEEQLYRRVNIYLPSGYNDSIVNRKSSNRKYPVLYLLHGINGYEGSWTERGRVIQIMENLVAQGRCQPMIIVMPDVNVDAREDEPSHHTLWRNVFTYPRLCRDHRIEKSLIELMQHIDTLYPVTDERYIAGLSDGARLMANVSNALPGYFSALGFFSPVVKKKQLPITNEQSPITNYFIYTGKNDMFHGSAKRFHRRLEKAHYPHHYTESIGGHTWRNWRLYLVDFLENVRSFTSLAV